MANTSDNPEQPVKDKNTNLSTTNYRPKIALAAGTILFLWFAALGIIFQNFYHETRLAELGQVGDSINILNTLFSGGALAGVVITLYIQMIELKEMQRIHSEQARHQENAAAISGLTAMLNYHSEQALILRTRLDNVVKQYHDKTSGQDFRLIPKNRRDDIEHEMLNSILDFHTPRYEKMLLHDRKVEEIESHLRTQLSKVNINLENQKTIVVGESDEDQADRLVRESFKLYIWLAMQDHQST